MPLPDHLRFPGGLSGVRCPACDEFGLRGVYAIDRLPVMSNLLVQTAPEAQSFPAGRLELAMCERCGFLSNTAFDPAHIELSARYEATQGFSATFNRFARELAQAWIDRYDIRNKRVVEVGCGQGEFLSLIAELGDNTCIGYDPALIPGRSPAPARGSVQLHAELVTDQTALDADVILCRHTLEHIHRPLEFLRLLRRTGGDALLLIEVPDTRRVLELGCFWDIFYEHCSYFCEASLRSCLRSAGYEPLATRLEFGGQYLIAEAAPTNAPAVVDDPAEVLAAAERFREVARQKIVHWTRFFDSAASEGRSIALWGAGSKAAGFLTTLARPEPVRVVDINPNKHNSFIPMTAQPVVSPDALRPRPPTDVIVMNPVYTNEIAQQLQSMGIHAKLHPLD